MVIPMRTSASDPIRVDFLAAAHLGDAAAGRIGLTIAPGKRDRARHWDRDLTADLARLRTDHGAHVLVSLMEDHEYAMLQIPELQARAEAAGLDVRRFPIRDVDAPKAAQMAEFATLVDNIVEAARAGQHVIIHCRGGLGRSGLVAACCLVNLGMTPVAAIAATRAARPGAVEVEPQEAWVATYAKHHAAAPRSRRARQPPPTGRLIKTEVNLDERTRARPVGGPHSSTVRGCLLGGALGDALGYPIEFITAAEIEHRYGVDAPGRLNFDGAALGRISDDTQMTLFTAEGLVRAWQRFRRRGICHAPTVVGFALLRWYETQGGPQMLDPERRGWLVDDRRLHAKRAPGNTCMSALGALAKGAEGAAPPTVETPPNQSKGCGAVMRAAPCGLAARTPEDAFELARDTGVITHGHPSGYLSGAYFAAVIWHVARGATLAAAMISADVLLAPELGAAELQAILVRTRALAAAGVPDVAAIESLGGGWTGEEALAIALLCALTFDEGSDVRAVLWRAAAHSGDSDSTAAITGNLIGAMYGLGILPPSWLAVLELRDVTERIAMDLFAACIEGEDLAEYPGI